MSYLVRMAYRAARAGNFECDNVKERAPCLAPDWLRREGFSTVNVLRAFCDVNNIELDSASAYGEPGYGNEHTKAVLLSNWNHIPRKLQDRLESQGFELEWSDEWTTDNDKAWRTEPDCHGWQPSTAVTEGGELLTRESDVEEWIDEFINVDKPLPGWFDTSELETRGYGELPPSIDVGLHAGMDNGTEVMAKLKALRDDGYDTLLVRGEASQFYSTYSIYNRREAKRELYASDSRGVYIPKHFAESIQRDHVTGIDGHDWLILEAGPDHELYWDVWQEVLDNAVVTDDNGVAYRLEQDGDLWLVEAAGEYCEHEDTYYVSKQS